METMSFSVNVPPIDLLRTLTEHFTVKQITVYDSGKTMQYSNIIRFRALSSI